MSDHNYLKKLLIRPLGSFLAAVYLFSSTACVTRASELEHHSLKVGSLTRSFELARPKSSCKAVIIAFHGGGGQAKKFSELAGDLTQRAWNKGFCILYPDAIQRQWNDGRQDGGVDDLAFFDALLVELKRQKLPADKVFLTGISNGGLMSFRLACERSEKLYAIAPIAAAMGEKLSENCRPQVPISILQVFGDKDPLIPFDGGEIRLPILRKARGRVLSQAQTWELWQKLNRCEGQKQESFLKAPPADYAVERISWTGCPAGIEGERYVIQGAGHTWPGGRPYLWEFMVGALAKSFDANDQILEFFQRRLVSVFLHNEHAKRL